MADLDRILVVDDEDGIRRMVTRMIASDSRDVETAPSGEDALQRLTDNAYDLYILDKNLPGMSGLELAQQIRRLDRAAAILILTGFATHSSALDALNIGVDGYAEKPVRAESLRRQVDDALAAAHRRRSLSDRLRSARAAARNTLDQLDKPGKMLAIVVAHANATIARALADELGASGVVEIVADLAGLEGQLAASAPNLLLADTGLGDDLVPTLRNVRDHHPNVAVIVTGQTQSLKEVQAFIFSGVRAVIDRPLSNGVLDERLLREIHILRRH